MDCKEKLEMEEVMEERRRIGRQGKKGERRRQRGKGWRERKRKGRTKKKVRREEETTTGKEEGKERRKEERRKGEREAWRKGGGETGNAISSSNIQIIKNHTVFRGEKSNKEIFSVIQTDKTKYI